jgi:hypothetical protein
VAQLALTRDDRNAGDDVSWWQATSRGGRAGGLKSSGDPGGKGKRL